MKKKLQLRKKLATFVALLCLTTMMPLTVWAQQTVVNVVEQNVRITQYSTLYVGDVWVDGQRSFYYLYSEDLTNSETVFAAVRDGLSDFNDGTYSALVPDIIGENDELGISICSNSAYEPVMNSDWKQADKAGMACLPNTTVISSSSEDLYETDADFATNCADDFIGVSIVNDAGVSQAISGILSKLSTSITDDVTYTVENGVLVKLIDRHIDYTCEMTTVIYTKVELVTTNTSTPRGDVNGDGDVNITDVALTVNHILGNFNDSFNEAAADLNGDGEVNITDVVTLVDIILNGDDIPDLELSATAVVVTGESATVEIISGSGNYELSVSDPDVIDASLDGSKVIITSKVPGTMEVEVTQTTPANAPRKASVIHHSTVTIKDMDTYQTAVIKVTVTEESYLTCPDDHHPHMIDLGLPSSTKWACCNVGATTPEGYGGYYAWGETEEKSYYGLVDYIHCDGSEETYHDLGSDIASTVYDVAFVKWGSSWVMPSIDQQLELLNNCTNEWTTINGVNCIKFTGPNGGTTFFPATGSRSYGYLWNVGERGLFWSSTPTQNMPGSANGISINLDSQWGPAITFGLNNRTSGYTVRPVVASTRLNHLALSCGSLELTRGESSTVEITSGNGNYEISNSNPEVVTVSLNGTIITLTGKSGGLATVTVKDSRTYATKEITVTVAIPVNLTCPDENHPHMIDLGLPSGIQWACCNVDATTPEEYGGYYAWGETEEKDMYNPVTYQYATGVDEDGDGSYDDYNYDIYCYGEWQDIGSDIACTQYDVAHVKWGGAWAMPSENQIRELMEYCTNGWTTINGVNGCKFTSKANGLTIFLPLAGYRSYGALFYTGEYGFYWSSTLGYVSRAYSMCVNSNEIRNWSEQRDNGFTVRPVSR